nr:MAG TPA: hypothetical protein [Caudoviricetes sp.]
MDLDFLGSTFLFIFVLLRSLYLYNELLDLKNT